MDGAQPPTGSADKPTLRRSLSLPLLVLFGLGTTIGAGIYVLLGEVVGRAGVFAAVAFLVASVLAGISGFSFAELSARFPRSAGEALYVRHGLNSRTLALVVGLMVVFAGSVSSAAIVHGFAGYAREVVDLPRDPIVVAAIIALGAVTVWGIRESVSLAAILTAFEIAGLVLVIGAGAWAVSTHGPVVQTETFSSLGAAGLGIGSAAVLAFYAFIGFEDLVNVAEEVRDVEHAMPRAILWTLAATLVLYVAVALVAVAVAPIDGLRASEAPLAYVFVMASGRSGAVIVAIGLFAVVNGALIQMIMASRVLYGLSALGWLPGPFGRIYPRTRTPVVATVFVVGVMTVLALWLPLVRLAELTSIATLIIFTLVNLALWRLKRQAVPADAATARPRFTVPIWVPVLGSIVSAGFVVYGVWAYLL